MKVSTSSWISASDSSPSLSDISISRSRKANRFRLPANKSLHLNHHLWTSQQWFNFNCSLPVWLLLHNSPSGDELKFLRCCPASRRRRQKVNPVPMRYNWATLSLVNVNTWTWCSRLGAGGKADDWAVKETLVAKSKDVKPGCNLV
jgi:hypothetical protein